MTRLPVIVGFGGFNAAGRSSFHQSYQRIVIESLETSKRQETLAGLAVMMGKVTVDKGHYYSGDQQVSPAEIESLYGQAICDNTLIRRISKTFFDVDRVHFHENIQLDEQDSSFEISKKALPNPLPEGWALATGSSLDDDHKKVRVRLSANTPLRTPSYRKLSVQSAGQLPEGFAPDALYNSRFHPRGLQLAIIGASDAINAMGIEWQTILDKVSPDEIGSYSSSVMSQLDATGLGGLMQSRVAGERASTKQLPLGLASMPSDFINAYVLGNLGSTGTMVGACASFLYNLRAGVEDIQSGRRRVVMVSSSEAPIIPEVIDGYNAMGALATTDKLRKLDGGDTDLHRSSRPFAENCGFVISESSQHVILMDDELAMELGADIHGAVSDVFVNADGFKKSISAPGPGNYITLAKALASARSLLGDEALAKRSFVQAHGSSTPHNRQTESLILDKVAASFGISHWPVTAVKAFVGHSLAPASGDQLINTLGVFNQGILPGIKTASSIADDVVQDHLSISTSDTELGPDLDVAFLNSKGFGGNNASASVLSPKRVEQMLAKRYGTKAMSAYQAKREATQARALEYHHGFLQGDYRSIYHFGENMIDEDEIQLSAESISLPGRDKPIDLTKENLYKDMI